MNIGVEARREEWNNPLDEIREKINKNIRKKYKKESNQTNRRG